MTVNSPVKQKPLNCSITSTNRNYFRLMTKTAKNYIWIKKLSTVFTWYKWLINFWKWLFLFFVVFIWRFRLRLLPGFVIKPSSTKFSKSEKPDFNSGLVDDIDCLADIACPCRPWIAMEHCRRNRYHHKQRFNPCALRPKSSMRGEMAKMKISSLDNTYLTSFFTLLALLQMIAKN